MHSPRFSLAAPGRALAPALQHKIDRKTKPLGALGQLEVIALRVGLIQQTLEPRLDNPHMLIFASDHGAARAGVSAFPQEVTWQMVENFLAGGAAINVFARQNGLALTVVDAGVAHDFGSEKSGSDPGFEERGQTPMSSVTPPRFINASMGPGTRNYIEEPAMGEAECLAALEKGAGIVRGLAEEGCRVVGFGEMGIGNTASAALITHCLTGASLVDCVGRGTGLDDAGLARKRALLEQALARAGRVEAPLAVLAQFGGYEIAMMAGAMIAAAQTGLVLLIDGFIVGAAALVAARLAPALTEYCVFCHRSAEPGHRAQLAALGAEPLLDLGLRLGEGTGAALAFPLVQAAVNFLNDMASFESAGVADSC